MSSDSETMGMVQEFKTHTDFTLFFLTLIFVASFIVIYLMIPDLGWELINAASDWMYTNLAWMYMLSMVSFVLVTVFMIFGPWGRIKLGGEDAEPEHSYFQYWAIFFSAGIAAGIVFWGPAEAIYHFEYVPAIFDAAPQSKAAMEPALRTAFFHWGFSAWASYVIFGIPIAYYVYNKGAPMRISTILAPIIGVERAENSVLGRIIDLISIIGVLGGISTSLGLVGEQMLSGLTYQYGMQFSNFEIILVIAGFTLLINLTTVSGLERGIQWISKANIYGFFIMMVALFILGPTMFQLNLATSAFGNYLNNFISMSTFTNASNNVSWVGSWTIFYWGWWLAFAPMMGIYMARLSKGRTIREMAFTGVIATTSGVIPWYALFGGTAINFQFTGRADILGAVSEYGVEVAGFALFNGMPFSLLLGALFFFLVITFFVTTADAASYGVSMIVESGRENPSGLNRLVWGTSMGLIASILLIIGGLEALKAASIMTGAPLAIVGMVAVVGTIMEFRDRYGRVLIIEDNYLTPKTGPQEASEDSPVAVSDDD